MRKNGFTLVELMIVVTILGILAAIVIPEFQGHAAESRESAVKSSLHTVRCQIELYKMQHNNLNPGYYNTTSTAVPSMLANQFIGTSRLTGLAVPSKTPADPYLYGPYLMQMPVNPFNNLNTVTIVTDGTTDFSAVANDTSGWLYEKTTGTFKVNYSGTDSNGVAYVDY
jgi:prepilin-type N-terminal cleavage/methylation domain-containing protein